MGFYIVKHNKNHNDLNKKKNDIVEIEYKTKFVESSCNKVTNFVKSKSIEAIVDAWDNFKGFEQTL